ncbi:MAG: RNA pseudouridine synthase, partial [Crocinitomicaceae bacterium]|nr:RNA pseudouridine synthase [Crocinitomicaceae bacterium]
MNWDHDFGLDPNSEKGAGKMFGVLVVQNEEGELGYLSAFSGKIANSNLHLGFVPPVFDMLDPNGFFVRDMNELSEINKVTAELLSNPEVEIRKTLAEQYVSESKIEIEAHREKMRIAKSERKIRRMEGDIEMTNDAFRILEKELSKESMMYKHQLKVLTEEWTVKINEAQSSLSELMKRINFLKKDRKKKSNILQQKLFDQYDFLNQNGKLKNVRPIFKDTALKVPPSAAGECAAPKLL